MPGARIVDSAIDSATAKLLATGIVQRLAVPFSILDGNFSSAVEDANKTVAIDSASASATASPIQDSKGPASEQQPEADMFTLHSGADRMTVSAQYLLGEWHIACPYSSRTLRSGD